MTLIINSNISSTQAQRSLNTSATSLSKTLERLSSGYRVNGASDDAAGLSIGTRMQAQVRGITKAIGNANDAISLTQTADGAMNELTGLLQRMRELTVQSLSETNTLGDRQKIQAEVDQLVQEVDRIGQLEFNEKKLFGGNFDFQLGSDTNSASLMSFSTNKLASNRLGSHSTFISNAVSTTNPLAAGDLAFILSDGTSVAVRESLATDDRVSTANQAGSAIAKAAAVNAGTQDHGVSAQAMATVLTSSGISAQQVLGEGDVLTINGEKITGFTVTENDADGTLVSAINAVSEETGVVATLNGDGAITLTAKDGRNIAIGATGNAANLGFTDGTVQGGSLRFKSRDTYTLQVASDDVNTLACGGICDSIASQGDPLEGIDAEVGEYRTFGVPGGPDLFFGLSQQAGVATITSVGGFYTENGVPDGDLTGKEFHMVWHNNTANLYAADPGANFVDGNMDPDRGLIDSSANAVPAIGDSATVSFEVNGTTFSITYTNDGIDDSLNTGGESADTRSSGIKFTLDAGSLGSGGGGEGVMGKNFTDSSIASISVGELNDVLTTASAERALGIIDFALDEVNATRSELGALSNRLSSTVSNLSQTKNNISDARSRIMDADFANETALLSKTQIVQQAGVSVLAQANASQQIVLSLL